MMKLCLPEVVTKVFEVAMIKVIVEGVGLDLAVLVVEEEVIAVEAITHTVQIIDLILEHVIIVMNQVIFHLHVPETT